MGKHLILSNAESVPGAALRDTITGDTAANRMEGGIGSDTLNGGLGLGTLVGGAGADLMAGQAGNDLLVGGLGADVFQFSAGHGRHRIADFTLGHDLIDFTAALEVGDVTFAAVTGGVLLSVGNAQVQVDGVTVLHMKDAANFLFRGPASRGPAAHAGRTDPWLDDLRRSLHSARQRKTTGSSTRKRAASPWPLLHRFRVSSS